MREHVFVWLQVWKVMVRWLVRYDKCMQVYLNMCLYDCKCLESRDDTLSR